MSEGELVCFVSDVGEEYMTEDCIMVMTYGGCEPEDAFHVHIQSGAFERRGK